MIESDASCMIEGLYISLDYSQCGCGIHTTISITSDIIIIWQNVQIEHNCKAIFDTIMFIYQWLEGQEIRYYTYVCMQLFLTTHRRGAEGADT